MTERRLKQSGILTVGGLRAFDLATLEVQFGRFGARLYQLAQGIDHNPGIPNRPIKSISAEDTFEQDIPLSETDDLIRKLAEKVWTASRRESRVARTVCVQTKNERVPHPHAELYARRTTQLLRRTHRYCAFLARAGRSWSEQALSSGGHWHEQLYEPPTQPVAEALEV